MENNNNKEQHRDTQSCDNEQFCITEPDELQLHSNAGHSVKEQSHDTQCGDKLLCNCSDTPQTHDQKEGCHSIMQHQDINQNKMEQDLSLKHQNKEHYSDTKTDSSKALHGDTAYSETSTTLCNGVENLSGPEQCSEHQCSEEYCQLQQLCEREQCCGLEDSSNVHKRCNDEENIDRCETGGDGDEKLDDEPNNPQETGQHRSMKQQQQDDDAGHHDGNKQPNNTGQHIATEQQNGTGQVTGCELRHNSRQAGNRQHGTRHNDGIDIVEQAGNKQGGDVEQHRIPTQHDDTRQHDNAQHELSDQHLEVGSKQGNDMEHSNPEEVCGGALMSDKENDCGLEQPNRTEGFNNAEERHSDENGEAVLLALNDGYIDVDVDDEVMWEDSAERCDKEDACLVTNNDNRRVNRENVSDHDKLFHRENDMCQGFANTQTKEMNFIETVRDDSEKCVCGCKEDHVKVRCDEFSENEFVKKNNKGDVPCMVCQLKDVDSDHWNANMDREEGEEIFNTDDRDGEFSQAGGDSTDVSQKSKNIYTDASTKNQACEDSGSVNQHDSKVSVCCDCKRLQKISHDSGDGLSLPAEEAFSTRHEIDNDLESESSDLRILNNNNVKTCRAQEENRTQDNTNINTENVQSKNDEHENKEKLPTTRAAEDSSTKTQVESPPGNNSAQKSHAGHHRWTAAFALLRKTFHKPETKSPKDAPSTLATISDKLPDTGHGGILHSGSHPHHPSSPQKKLTFQIPEPAHKNGGTANGTVIVHAHHAKSGSGSGSLRKLSKRFSFPALSKTRRSKKSADTSQPPDAGNNPVRSRSSSDQPTGSQSSSQSRPPKRQSIPQTPLNQQTDRKSRSCPSLWDKLHKWWQGDSSIEGKEIRNTLIVGVAFQLIFTAHFAIQNLQSSLHEEEYLGVSALGCLYAASIFSSIFAPTIIGLLGLKGCLVLAWLTHMLYTLAQFYPSWQTLVPASVLLGALTGPTWTAQGVYVSACAFSFSRRSPHSPYTILSRFNGLFFSLYETRQVLGNLLSSVVLRHGVGNKSQEIIFKYCGPRDCPAAENVTDIEEPEALVIHSMLAIYTALQVVALLLTIVFLTPLSRSEWVSRAPIRETATSWFKTLVGTRMLFLVPFMVFQAIQQGMLLSEYTKSYISCPIGIHMVGFVMATHGATSAVFVFIFSRLARRTGRFPLFALASVITLALLIVLYDWTPQSDQQALIFVFPVLWGIGEGIWQTQTNSMIAVLFWKRKESAFANYQTWRAVGFTFIFSFHSILCVYIKIAITMAFLVVGMILYTGVEIHSYRKEHSSSSSAATLPKDDAHVASGSASHSSSSSSSSSPQGNSSSGGVALEERPQGGLPEQRTDFELGITPPVCTINNSSSAMFRMFRFEDETDLENGGHVTLDGTYLSRGESAFLDNDLQRYGVVPSGGTRPLTHAHLAKSSSEDCDRWTVRDQQESARKNGSAESSNQRLARPHTWHEISAFEDEGELRVLRTKNDVLVY